MKTITYINLNNDLTGSVQVLLDVIRICQKNSIGTRTYISSGPCDQEINTLSKLKKIRRLKILGNLFLPFDFLFSQLYLFFKLVLNGESKKTDMIVVNTILPFAAALYAKLFSVKLCYYVHEVSVNNKLLNSFLMYVMNHTADKVICVSRFQMQYLNFPLKVCVSLISNSVRQDVALAASSFDYLNKIRDRFNVYLISSLRSYKGVDEFLMIARMFESNFGIKFTLVANEEQSVVDNFKVRNSIPENLEIFHRTSNISIHYKAADLLLNLTNPRYCIESFGLTVVEAMSFGIPVIVPKHGGVAELVHYGVNGYHADCSELDRIFSMIVDISTNKSLRNSLSENAKNISRAFSHEKYERKLIDCLSK